MARNNTCRTVTGRGLVGDVVGKVGNVVSTVLNKGIDVLPIELHLPGGYRYCGPGTNLTVRLARGDPGINKLDEACKAHDIAYSKYKDNANRRKADQLLADRAWARVKSSDASVGERVAAWAVTTAMNTKTKLGGNLKKSKTKKNSTKRMRDGKGLYLKPYRDGKGMYLKPYNGGGKTENTRKKAHRYVTVQYN